MIGLEIITPHAEPITPKYFPNWEKGSLGLIEECGRECYQSEPKGEPDVFVQRVSQHLGHESIIEHWGFTFRIVCSRACSHQLVRHRLAAFSQESQRFCDYSGKLTKYIGASYVGVTDEEVHILPVIIPPSVGKDLLGGRIILAGRATATGRALVVDKGQKVTLRAFIQDRLPEDHLDLLDDWLELMLAEFRFYNKQRAFGIPPEDARFPLGQAAKTSVMTTFNYRMWRHVIKHRALNKRAQWEIKNILLSVRDYFGKALPAIFGDLLEKV